MRISCLTVTLVTSLVALTASSVHAQSGTTNFSDIGTSVVEGSIGGSDAAPVFSDGGIGGFTQPSYTYSDPVQYQMAPVQQQMAPAPAAAPAKKKNPAVGAHKAVYYANDFSYLTNDYTGPTYLGDGLKNLTLGRGKLDIGGELRTRYHFENGLGQQAGATRFQDTNNEFGLIRLRAYADYKASDRLRFFAEGIYADETFSNDEYINRPIDINRGDILNLFADVKITDNAIVRIGRQELIYGDQRVVSPLDWVNTRQRFDGARILAKYDDWAIDAFYTQFVPVQANSFDNPNEDLDFYGVYGTYKGWERDTLEMYYLGFNNDTGPDDTFNLNTFGTRLFGKRGDWLYEFEGAAQTGIQNALDQDHTAFAGTFGLGRKFANRPWKPALWFFYDIATGNEVESTDTFERYNQLFPLAHKYLGFIDAVTRNNISSPNVRLKLQPTEKLSLLFWYYNFQAVENFDPITSIGGTPAQDPSSEEFGNELDFVANYNINPRSSVLIGYSHFWAGDRIVNGNDADFTYIQVTRRF